MVQTTSRRRHDLFSRKSHPSKLLDTPQAVVPDKWLLHSPSETMNRPVLRLDTLTVELFFEILEHMDLQDALRLRLVSRHCAGLVLQAPSILKRLLRHVKAPLPYSPRPIQSLSGKEIISLCRRAFALQANWERKLDRVRAHNFFPLHRSYLVSLVPGGRYLITAYHSASGSEHGIALYDLENECGITCLGTCPTKTPLESLDASWMRHNGNQGIVITWKRERVSRKKVEDPRIEVTVLFTALDTLDLLANPQEDQNIAPFEVVFSKHWEHSIIHASTTNAMLAVSLSPNTLEFYHLEKGTNSKLILPALPNSQMIDPVIFGIKLLCDGAVLIVRGEDGHSPEACLHGIETYEIPRWGQTVGSPVPVQCNYLYSNQTEYAISAMYTRQPTCDKPTEEETKEALGYFPTVTLTVESTYPVKGITQYRLYPIYVPEEAPHFRYQWPMNVWQGHYTENDQHRTMTRTLAGADRSLGFPYNAPGLSYTPSLGEFMVLDSHGDGGIPSVTLPEAIERDIVRCVAWDEGSGKVCLSTGYDLKIWVLDFAV